MALTPPKRLFHVPSMSTVMYVDVVDDVSEKGYAAISHMWGEQAIYTASELGIRGVDWTIPLSDLKKIHRLVNAMIHYKKEYCWFDVLCMPQDKQDEINKEIPFMGDYYSGADITLVMGTKDYERPEEFSKSIDRISSIVEKKWMPKIVRGVWRHTIMTEMGIHKDPWFTRVWTFQEAALSKSIQFVGFSKSYYDLSGTLEGLPEREWKSGDMLPGRAWEPIGNNPSEWEPMESNPLAEPGQRLVELSHTIEDYRRGEIRLANIMHKCYLRHCYKEQDKFYGAFGILGYKSFPIDYNISMKDLNIKIIQYAYSKGDVSWLAVGNVYEIGFIQQMYESFKPMKGDWKEASPGICDIRFNHDSLRINACIIAIVGSRQEIVLHPVPFEQIIGAVCTLKEWGFSNNAIASVLTLYRELSPTEISLLGVFFDRAYKGKSAVNATIRMVAKAILKKESVPELLIKLRRDMDEIDSEYVYEITPIGGSEKYPLLINGNAEFGDRIMLLRIYDDIGRNFGIVVDDSFRRKGVCILPKNSSFEYHVSHNYTTYELPL